jgi:hypothetical protein
MTPSPTGTPRPEAAFLALGIAFGLLFVLLTPPFQANDEWNHFFRAYQVSEGGWLAERDAGGMAGGRVPRSLLLTSVCVFHNIPYTEDRVPRIQAILMRGGLDDATMNPLGKGYGSTRPAVLRSLLRVPLAPGDRVFMYFGRTAAYAPAAYLPQAAGIALGRAAGLSPLGLLYAGRLANLVFWLILIRAAIGMAPLGKWLFALPALLPSTVFLAASLSVDAMAIGLAFLLAALALRAAYDADDGLTPKRAALAAGLAVGLALTKYYVFIPLTFAVVPARNVGLRRGNLLLAGALFLLALGIAGAWTSYASGYLSGPGSAVSPEGQIAALREDPLMLASATLKALARYGSAYLRDATGRLGHYALYMPGWTVALAWVLPIAAALLGGEQGEPRRIPVAHRAVFALIALLSMGPVILSTYLAWTPVGHDVVEGLQGRYVIPVLPLFFLALCRPHPAPRGMRRLLPAALALSAAALLLAAAFTLVEGYA